MSTEEKRCRICSDMITPDGYGDWVHVVRDMSGQVIGLYYMCERKSGEVATP